MQIILSSGGSISYISTSCRRLLGYEPEQLIRQKITDYIHEDDLPIFASEFFESQTTGKTFRFHCRVRRAQSLVASDDGPLSPGVVASMPEFAIFEIQGHYEAIEPAAGSPAAVILQPDGGAGGFFSLMARPYPLSQSAEIDRFLTLKLEEMVLNSHITQLRAEESVMEDAAPVSPTHLSPDGQFMETPPFFVPGMTPLVNPQPHQGSSLSPLDNPPDPAFSGPELQSPFISPTPNNQQPQPLSVSPPSGFPPQPSPYPLLPGMPPPLLRHGSNTDTATPSASFPSTPTPLAVAAAPVCNVAPTSRTPTVVSGDLGIMYTLKSVKQSPDTGPVMMPPTPVGVGPPPPGVPPGQPGGISVPGGYFASDASATEMPPTSLLDRAGGPPFSGAPGPQQQPFPPPQPFPTTAGAGGPTPGFPPSTFPPVPMQTANVPMQPGPPGPPFAAPPGAGMAAMPGPAGFVGPSGVPLDLVMLPPHHPHQTQHTPLGMGMGPEPPHGSVGVPGASGIAVAGGGVGGAVAKGSAAGSVAAGAKAAAQGKGYMCVECGTTQAPEWRRGPMGPKTLCNACGRESPLSVSPSHSQRPPLPTRLRSAIRCVCARTDRVRQCAGPRGPMARIVVIKRRRRQQRQLWRGKTSRSVRRVVVVVVVLLRRRGLGVQQGRERWPVNGWARSQGLVSMFEGPVTLCRGVARKGSLQQACLAKPGVLGRSKAGESKGR
ncbi:hypothetical protein HDK77DRAFT_439633 [Phyllosticta capitalensis]